MLSKIKEYQLLIYLILFAVSLVFLFISSNDLIFHSSAVVSSGLTLSATGGWLYWIFFVSISGSIAFLYMYLHIVSNTKKFHRLVESPSKHEFVKNIRELEKIARSLGSREMHLLKEAKKKWRVR